jgi:1-acyl-sn-glycerol-3-phosphate acyltransferase
MKKPNCSFSNLALTKRPWLIAFGGYLADIIRFPVLLFMAFAHWLIFMVFNQVEVIGLEQFPWQKNVLIVMNHQGYWDSSLVATVLILKRLCWRIWIPWNFFRHYFLIPWHSADFHNFVKAWRKPWAWACKIIPVFRQDDSFVTTNITFRRQREALERGILCNFPEGGRTRKPPHLLEKLMAGTGWLIFAKRPVVQPILILGMNEVQKIGDRYLKFRLRKKITIVFLPPLTPDGFSDLFAQGNTREVWEEITKRAFQPIREELDRRINEHCP